MTRLLTVAIAAVLVLSSGCGTQEATTVPQDATDAAIDSSQEASDGSTDSPPEATDSQCESEEWSEEIFVTSPPTFQVLTPREDELAADIAKVIDVFGVRIMALEGVSERDLILVANVLAQWIDNDEDGQPDNRMVQSELQRRNARMILGVTFDVIGPWHGEKQQFLVDEFAPTYGLDVTTIKHSLYGLEPSSYSDDWMISDPKRAPDAATEETFHLVTDIGYAGVYPAQFWPAFDYIGESASQVSKCFFWQNEGKGLEDNSLLTSAMDIARGGFWAEIPEQYPPEAWYMRYDECPYHCFVGEYLHWAAITRAGMMEGRLVGIPQDRNGGGDEWSIETAEELRQIDPRVSELLDQPDIYFPSIAPDGTYRE